MLRTLSHPSKFGQHVGRLYNKLVTSLSLPDVNHLLAHPSELPPIDLLHFPSPEQTPTQDEELAWTMSDDTVIGGSSSHTLTFNANTTRTSPTCPTNYLSWQGELNSKFSKKTSSPSSSSLPLPSSISEAIKRKTQENVLESSRSGFVSIRSPSLNPGSTDYLGDGSFINLDDYGGLEVFVRFDYSDGDDGDGDESGYKGDTKFMINLYVDSYIPGDLYQGYLVAPKVQPKLLTTLSKQPQWQKLTLPFSSFILTSEGRLRETQRPLLGFCRLKHIGVTAADTKSGSAGEGEKFRIDFGGVRAV